MCLSNLLFHLRRQQRILHQNLEVTQASDYLNDIKLFRQSFGSLIINSLKLVAFFPKTKVQVDEAKVVGKEEKHAIFGLQDDLPVFNLFFKFLFVHIFVWNQVLLPLLGLLLLATEKLIVINSGGVHLSGGC
jgi:hypothetical protein